MLLIFSYHQSFQRLVANPSRYNWLQRSFFFVSLASSNFTVGQILIDNKEQFALNAETRDEHLIDRDGICKWEKLANDRVEFAITHLLNAIQEILDKLLFFDIIILISDGPKVHVWMLLDVAPCVKGAMHAAAVAGDLRHHSDDDDTTFLLVFQTGEAVVQALLATDSVVRDGDAFAAVELADDLGHIFGLAIDGRDAEGPDKIEFALGAGAEHGQLHVEGMDKLGYGRADAARDRTDQDGRTRREGDAGAMEHAKRSHVVERQGADLDRIVVRPELDELCCRQDYVRRVRTVQAHARHEIALGKVLDACPDSINVAGKVVALAEAGLLDPLVRVAARALDVVRAGDTRDEDLDSDLVRARLW